jgi:AcrR family transcriptional regulator
MAVEKRREREIEEMKELILSTASEIITMEGLDKLSIRKIASEIEYSPSIIYHYFKDKEEIVNQVMQRGYKKIISAVSSAEVEQQTPKERLKLMTKNYIKAALAMPEEFMAAQLNNSDLALKHTASLFKGASKEKPALAALYQCLNEMYTGQEVSEDTLEMTSQMIAVSTLGLITKLIIEKDLDGEQKERLMEFYTNDIVFRIANKTY